MNILALSGLYLGAGGVAFGLAPLHHRSTVPGKARVNILALSGLHLGPALVSWNLGAGRVSVVDAQPAPQLRTMLVPWTLLQTRLTPASG